MTLPEFLALDTNPFIYEFDATGPRTEYLHAEVFLPLRGGLSRAVTSVITVSELLVPRLRAGDSPGAAAMESQLHAFPNLTVMPVARQIAFRAAELRSRYGLRLVDATHIATAIVAGADAFLTNDRQLLRAGDEFPVLILDDLLTSR